MQLRKLAKLPLGAGGVHRDAEDQHDPGRHPPHHQARPAPARQRAAGLGGAGGRAGARGPADSGCHGGAAGAAAWREAGARCSCQLACEPLPFLTGGAEGGACSF